MANIFSELAEIRTPVWIVIGLLVIASIVGLIVTRKHGHQRSINTKMLVYGGMCVALAFVLSYVKIWHMPQGGSITLASMLPLVLYAFAFGPVAGIVAGVAYGFLQLFQDMYVLHWAQVLLDYPLAFGFLGLAGIVPARIKSLQLRFGLGIFIGILGRYLMHVMSGAIFFAEYAGDMNPWIYSFGYNATYLSVELVITLVLGVILASTPIYKVMKTSIEL
ncbi:MAG: energy-coupled thiamine transporter ThiT [Cellulosilyticaceae bacterium]